MELSDRGFGLGAGVGFKVRPRTLYDSLKQLPQRNPNTKQLQLHISCGPSDLFRDRYLAACYNLGFPLKAHGGYRGLIRPMEETIGVTSGHVEFSLYP